MFSYYDSYILCCWVLCFYTFVLKTGKNDIRKQKYKDQVESNHKNAMCWANTSQHKHIFYAFRDS